MSFNSYDNWKLQSDWDQPYMQEPEPQYEIFMKGDGWDEVISRHEAEDEAEYAYEQEMRKYRKQVDNEPLDYILEIREVKRNDQLH
jgi:hypothetical protein